MKDILTRRQRRKTEKAFAAFARSAKETEAEIAGMMRQMRTAGYQWLAAIEVLESENPAEARLIPLGMKESCKLIVGRSADVELALGDTIAAVLSVHDSLRAVARLEQ